MLEKGIYKPETGGIFLQCYFPECSREGKNQEDFIGFEMDLLCEPDVSGLLRDLLCTLSTSCGPATVGLREAKGAIRTDPGHRRSKLSILGPRESAGPNPLLLPFVGPDTPLLVFTLDGMFNSFDAQTLLGFMYEYLIKIM